MEAKESLTRVEVEALITANEKVATQLTIIAGQLALITSGLEKVHGRLQNGLGAELVGTIVPKIESTTVKLDRIENRQEWMAWVLTATGAIVALVGVKAIYQILVGKI